MKHAAAHLGHVAAHKLHDVGDAAAHKLHDVGHAAAHILHHEPSKAHGKRRRAIKITDGLHHEPGEAPVSGGEAAARMKKTASELRRHEGNMHLARKHAMHFILQARGDIERYRGDVGEMHAP